MIPNQLLNKNNHLKLNEFSIRKDIFSEIPHDDYFLFQNQSQTFLYPLRKPYKHIKNNAILKFYFQFLHISNHDL